MEKEEVEQQNKKPHKISKKIIGVIVAPLILACLAVILIIFMQQNTPNSEESQEAAGEEVVQSPDTSQITNDVYEWIMSQEIENGSEYYESEVCTTDQASCEKRDSGQNIYALWGVYEYAKQTNNNTLFADIEDKLQTYTQQAAGTQNWTCKLLFDVTEDALITDDAKENARILCENATQQITSESITLSDLMQKMDSIMNTTTQDTEEVSNNAENEFTEATTRASDEAVKSLWNDTDATNEAFARFNNALTIYQSSEDAVSDKSPILVVASLDLYKLTNEQTFLQFAKFIYNKHSILKTCVSLTHCTDALFATKELAAVTEEEHYTQDINTFTQEAIEFSFDGNEYAHEIGKNAFYTEVDEGFMYPTRENALLLGILSQE